MPTACFRRRRALLQRKSGQLSLTALSLGRQIANGQKSEGFVLLPDRLAEAHQDSGDLGTGGHILGYEGVGAAHFMVSSAQPET